MMVAMEKILTATDIKLREKEFAQKLWQVHQDFMCEMTERLIPLLVLKLKEYQPDETTPGIQ